jgi:phage tail-like protein
MPEAAESAPSTPSAAQPGTFVDPYRAYNFKLQIQGVAEGQGHFTEISGFEIDVHPIRYREAGAAQVVHVIPGPVSYGEVTLRYGLTDSQELWRWMKSAANGHPQRRNVSIVLLDAAGELPVVTWSLINAWPRRWRGQQLDALNREVAIESLTIVFETLDRGQ